MIRRGINAKIRTEVRIFCVHLFHQHNLVDPKEFEPSTSALQTQRSRKVVGSVPVNKKQTVV